MLYYSEFYLNITLGMKMESQGIRTILFIVLLHITAYLRAEVIYLGNESQVRTLAIAADHNGNVYVSGNTLGPLQLSAPHVFHLETPGSGSNGFNVFVLKLDPAGSPVYLTYLGGDGWDYASGVAVDTNGNACIVGGTTSSNFPIVNALQSNLSDDDANAGDGFVAKLQADGSGLIFSTYFGGSGSDNCVDVKIDNSGKIVVAGTTTSTNFWCVNAIQSTNASVGGRSHVGGFGSLAGDSFVAKFTPSGSTLEYSTYLGGAGDDTVVALAVDEQGCAYVAGDTYSSNFPTRNEFHGSYTNNDLLGDVFLTKLSSNGQDLVFSTYIGGMDRDEAKGLAVDGSGNVYVAGTTASSDFPLLNAYPVRSGTNALLIPPNSRSFLTKFNGGGGSLEFSTFLTDPGFDSVGGIAVDEEQNLWIVGSQSSLSPADPFGFVARINSNGFPSLATDMFECSPGFEQNVVASPSRVWVIGATRDSIYTSTQPYQYLTYILSHVEGESASSNPPPLIHLARPTDGGFWGAGTSIPLIAAVADIGGSVSNVEIYCDGQQIGTLTNPPFETNHIISEIGLHTLQAIAQDNLGAKATSCPVHITVVSRPLNDDFEYSAIAPEMGVAATGSIHGATLEPGEPAFDGSWGLLSAGKASRTLWWCWRAPSNGVYTVFSEGTAFPEAVGVYTGFGLNDLTSVSSPRYCSNGLLHQLTFRGSSNAIYFISVGGDNEVLGDVVFQIRPANPPPNDDFENRILLSGLNPTAAASNVEATAQPGENPSTTRSISPGASVWWSWITPASGVFAISTDGSSFQTDVRIFTGTNLTKLKSVPSATLNSRSGQSYRTLLTFNATQGTRYEIKVDSAQSSVGDIHLQITPVTSPPNDQFADALRVVGANVSAGGSTFGATAEPGEPLNKGTLPHHSIWWKWSPPIDGAYRITAAASNTTPSLFVYSGSSLSNLALVISGRDARSTSSSSAVLKTQAAIKYRIAVDSPNDPGGDVRLQIEPVTPPANDDFSHGIPLTGASILISGTTSNATTEIGEPTALGTVWWSWTSPATTNYMLRFEYSANYPMARVFRGTNLTNLVAASEVINSAYGANPKTIFSAKAGEVLWIQVADGSSASGDFSFKLDFAEAALLPPNDNFSNRIELVGTDIQIPASTIGATVEADEPSAYCSIGQTVWWTWNAPSNAAFTISTRESGYGVPISVYTGTNLSTLVKQFNSIVGEIILDAQTGTPYQIVAGECSGPARDFALRIHPARPPSNDDFVNRILLGGSYVEATGSNFDATVESGEPSTSQYGSQPRSTVWWSWTAPASGTTSANATIRNSISANGGWFSGATIAVYTGSEINHLTRISGQQSGSFVFQAIAGQTYQIQVGGDSTGFINFTVNGPKPMQPAQLTAPQLTDRNLHFNVMTAPWRTNTLEISTDLVDWHELITFPPMTLQNPISLPVDDQPAIFYRLRSE